MNKYVAIGIIMLMLLVGVFGLGVYGIARTLIAEYGFITIDGQEMEGKYCGASNRRAITCEDYGGHVYQVKEYWEVE